jgi:hypothetical protein
MSCYSENISPATVKKSQTKINDLTDGVKTPLTSSRNSADQFNRLVQKH